MASGNPREITDVVALLKVYAKQRDLHKGTRLHVDLVKRGLLKKNCYVASTLVHMYAKCGALAKAAQVLEELPVRDVVCWSALITGYAQQGRGEEALKCFERMEREGLSPDAVTFTCVLKACGSTGAADKGEQIHKKIVQQNLLGKDILLDTTLVDMYAKCGALAKAAQVLDELPLRDVVSWNALIAGYVQQGQGERALKCLKRMQHEGLSPNAATFTCILKACGSIGAANKGDQIYEEIVKEGLLAKDIALGNSLVDMYAKCGALSKAARVLDELPVRDIISWSALITGYVQQDQGKEALICFERMRREGLSPNIVTFIFILKACGSIGATDKGEQFHDEIVRQGLLEKDIVLGTALVDMYVKCGALAKATQVLDELPVRDVVTWSALISGYAQQGKGEEALKCFERMQREGLSPDPVTFTCTLKACSSVGAAGKGKQIHDEILRRGLLGKDIVLGNTLVDMYAKCGGLAKAAQVLEELPVQDVVSWNALIAGYVQQGQGKEALKCFERMQCQGFSPDTATLACVLNACSRSRLLEEGQTCFANMSTKYGITPEVEHHTCMVDLFGRSGEFDKALAVIMKMPSSDHLPVWHALLGACQECGNVKLGRLAFDNAVQLDEKDAAAYILMVKTYAAAGMQEDANHIEAMREKWTMERARLCSRAAAP